MAPAIEANAERVFSQNTIEVGKARKHARRAIVLENLPPGSAPVVDEIRRIGDDKISAPIRQGLEYFGAVSFDDLICE